MPDPAARRFPMREAVMTVENSGIASSFVSVPDMIRHHARCRPNRTAWIVGDTQVSWSAFDARVNQVANALIENGVQ